MTLDQGELFGVIVAVFALTGFWRGWGREVITCAVVLCAVLFLISGGDRWFANHVLSLVPGMSDVQVAPGQPLPGPAALFSVIVLGIAAYTGFRLGGHYGSAPGTHEHRFFGILPGAVTGTAIAYYIGHSITPGTQFALSLTGPGHSVIGSSITGIYGVALSALFGFLIWTTRSSRKR